MENVEKKTLPNAVSSLVMGICSLVFSCWIVGFILGIIGVVISKKGKNLHLQNPNEYKGFGMLNAGRIMSIIGIVLGAIALVYWIVLIIALAAGGSMDMPWDWY